MSGILEMESLKKSLNRLQYIALIAGVYFVAAKIGLNFTVYHSSTPVWPCSGIALAALLILGYEFWPGIFLGAFLINLTITGNPLSSFGIAVGNSLEALVGAYLVFRYANGVESMKRSQDIFKLALIALLCSAIAATVGVRSLVGTGAIPPIPKAYDPVWLTWWGGDALGIIVFAPLLLVWRTSPSVEWKMKTVLEGAGLVACLVTISLVVFGGVLLPIPSNYPLEYLCVPFLIWAALRFGPREASVSIAILSAIAIWGTWQQHGPFSRVHAIDFLDGRTESMLQMQTFLGVGTIMTLVLAAEVAERRRSERDARFMSVSDRLTGLGNYRRLIDSLETEIVRSERMQRPFVFVLMDLDGLKQINDIHGHPEGNRALCRVSNVLKLNCRSIDTAARFGGDEFALILPESGIEFGHRIAERIRNRLANDGEFPVLSISIGLSVWTEGATADSLIQVADRALYENKHGHHKHIAVSKRV